MNFATDRSPAKAGVQLPFSVPLGPGPFDAACGVAQDRLLRGTRGEP